MQPSTPTPPSDSNKPLILILAGALLLRIAFPVLAVLLTGSFACFHSRDTLSYILPAGELLRHLTFSIDGVPDIYRTPGYSVLLAPGLLLPRLELWIIPLQIAMGVATVFGVFKIAGLTSGNRNVSLLAAALYAVDPLAVFYTSELSTETAFAFVLVAALYFFMTYLADDPADAGPGPLLASAALVAMSAYIRPISCYLPYALSAFLAGALLTRRLRRRNAVLHIALFFAVSAGLVFAWQIRNKAETGYPGFSSITGMSTYYYHAAAVRAKLEGRPYLDVQKQLGYDEELHLTEHPRERREDQALHFIAIEKEAGTILKRHASTYAPIHVAGMIRVFLDPGATGFLRVLDLEGDIDALIGDAVSGGLPHAILYFALHRPLVFWSNMALGLLLMVYYLGALAGLLYRRPPTQGILSAFLIAVAAYFIVISGGASAVSRFRHPIVPILCVFAASGLAALKRRFRPGPGQDDAMASKPDTRLASGLENPRR
jgi:hypothetical protein